MNKDMHTHQTHLLGSVFIQSWSLGNSFGRVLVVHHGLGEHSNRYRHLPQYLQNTFDAIYIFDAIGHGRTHGLQGHVDQFEDFLKTLSNIADFVQQRHPQAKRYLLGHSFGGLVSLKYLLSHRKPPFTAAILSAPLLGVAMKVPGYKKFMGNVLGKILPKIQLTNEINPSHLSHDPKVVEEYVNDKLVHDKITPGFYQELLRTMDEVNRSTGSIDVPVLFLIPGDDRVVDSQKTREFFEHLKHRDKSAIEYPEMFHEPHNEVGKEKVFVDIARWVAKNG